MGESANGIEFEKGFIAGLKQALRFEKAVEQSRAADWLCRCRNRARLIIGQPLPAKMLAKHAAASANR